MAENILFITSNRIGDAVLSTGLLAHVKKEHPDAAITIACGPIAAPLFMAHPQVEHVIAFTKEKNSRHWWKLWKKTIGTRWRMVIDVRASALSYFLWTKERRVLRMKGMTGHKVRQLADAFGLDYTPSPKIYAGEEHEAAARRLVPTGGPVLAIGPTANWMGKTWPAANFVELIHRLCERPGPFYQARVMVLSAPNEKKQALSVIKAVPEDRCIDIAGDVDLLTAYACLERATAYIGNDSGLMHMAAAAGIPTVGLFGPSREEVYGPWGRKTFAIRGSKTYDEIVGAHDYDHTKPVSYMGGLSVERVEIVIDQLLRGRQ